jgi:hypothetical protein
MSVLTEFRQGAIRKDATDQEQGCSFTREIKILKGNGIATKATELQALALTAAFGYYGLTACTQRNSFNQLLCNREALNTNCHNCLKLLHVSGHPGKAVY